VSGGGGDHMTMPESGRAMCYYPIYELVDWQGLKLPSAERRQRDSLKGFERSVEVWKDWIRLKKELATR